MKVSIITVCFNSAATLEHTLASVRGQSYKDIEYIVIDGGSTDGTIEIIEQHKEQIDVVKVESDKGIYDAMNKGIALASGEIVGILNSDDVYFNDLVLEKVVDRFRCSNVEMVYGDLVYFKGDNNNVIRKWITGQYTQGAFFNGWHPPHPSFFVRRDVYNRMGLYLDNFKIAADFEMMVRLFEKHRLRSEYLAEYLVRMRIGGASNRSISNILQGRREIKEAFSANGFSIPLFYFTSRYFRKIASYLKQL